MRQGTENDGWKQTDWLKGGQTDRQTDRQTDGQTDRHRQKHSVRWRHRARV